MVASNFNARNAAVYEQSMGRWSRHLALPFLAFADIGAVSRVLDVGCGTGSLTLALAKSCPDVVGIDASPIYVAAAQDRAPPGVHIAVGDALALDFPDASFDAALSQLVLQFIPDAGCVAAEMRRVVRPGGIVAAAVWASSGGMTIQRMFWDTAAGIDPDATEKRAHTFTRPMTRRGELTTAWQACGLEDVREDSVSIWMEFSSFADYWDPIAAGEGTLGKYVAALTPDLRARLERAMRAAYESGAPDGPRSFVASAWVCRGRVPA
jgi:SAM-dependent methyltransferase